MRKYYCVGCQKKFKVKWWHVNTTWHPNVKQYMHVHWVTCPYCDKKRSISFWKMPIKAKMRFIKEALSFQ